LGTVLKLILGLLKGAVVGGALGYGAYALDLGGAMLWVTYGLAGALAGLIAGRPLWALITDKEGTSWVSVLKALFGFGVGCGLYALVAKAWGGFDITLNGETRLYQLWQPIFGASIGGFLGAFFEIDDAIGGDAPKGKGAAALPARAGAGAAKRKADAGD
jgi:hypothetical protein